MTSRSGCSWESLGDVADDCGQSQDAAWELCPLSRISIVSVCYRV